jgi:hypothetical protein
LTPPGLQPTLGEDCAARAAGRSPNLEERTVRNQQNRAMQIISAVVLIFLAVVMVVTAVAPM